MHLKCQNLVWHQVTHKMGHTKLYTTQEEWYNKLNSLMMSLVLNFVVRWLLKREMEGNYGTSFELLSGYSTQQ